MEYNFDYLKNMYEKDPSEFEKITKSMIDRVINKVRKENREIFRAKQWRLEQELNKIKNPLERMNRMVCIFWVGVNEFINVTKNLKHGRDLFEQTKSCQVIDIKKED